MRRTVSLILFLAALGASAPISSAQERDDEAVRQEEAEEYFKKWLTQDVCYIISDEEKAVFNALGTQEEKEQFIEQFWLRRDPDPRTAYNEFKEEHYRRIAYANEQFTSGDPGWMTDRGKIYIIHGPPAAIESRPQGGNYVRPIEEGGGSTAVYPYEKWRYHYIEGLGQDVELEFVDTTWTGKFQLAVFPWEKDVLLMNGAGRTLMEDIGIMERKDHPALVPAANGAGYGPGSRYMRTKDRPFARYETFAKVQAPPIEKYKDLKELVQVDVTFHNLPLQTSQEYFRLNDAEVLVPITVQVQNNEVTFKQERDQYVARLAVAGIVTSLANRLVMEFEDDLLTRYTPAQFEQGILKSSAYQKVLKLDRRMRYKIDLIVKDLNSGKAGVIREALIPPSFEEEKLQGSSLLLSDYIQALETIPEDEEMFVLGDVKILPRMDKRFTNKMPLGVYLQVYNASLDQTSLSPSLEVTYSLLKDGVLLKAATEVGGESIQFFSARRVVLIKQLSLADLEPGGYRIQLQIEDRINKQRFSKSEDFRIVEES